MTLSPHLIDGILGLVILEFVALSLWLARRGSKRLIPALAAFLLSGALILAALRVSLSAATNDALALGLITLSLPAHLAALILIWRQASRQ